MAKQISSKIVRTASATPDEVFSALTTSKKIAAWCAQKGSVQAKIGGKFSMFDGWVKGVVLAYEPGVQLSYTWLPSDWPEGTQPSIVSIALKKKAGGTTITLKHSGFPNAKEQKGHEAGWDEYVFTPLILWLKQSK